MISTIIGSQLVQALIAVAVGVISFFVAKTAWKRQGKLEEKDRAKEKDRDNAAEIRDRVESADDKWMSKGRNDHGDGYRD